MKLIKETVGAKEGIRTDEFVLSLGGEVLDDFAGRRLQWYASELCEQTVLNVELVKGGQRGTVPTLTTSLQSHLGSRGLLHERKMISVRVS